MKEENLAIANVGEPTVRMTRARAAACHAFGGIPPSEALKQQGQKQVLRTSSKRAALDEMNSSASAAAPVQHKRRAVLKDVTNVCCENSYKNCLIAAKIPFHATELLPLKDEDVVAKAMSYLSKCIKDFENVAVIDKEIGRFPKSLTHFFPGSYKYMMRGSTSFPNLFMAGDWIITRHGSWSQEKSFVTGLEAANRVVDYLEEGTFAKIIPVEEDEPHIQALRNLNRNLNEIRAQLPWSNYFIQREIFVSTVALYMFQNQVLAAQQSPENPNWFQVIRASTEFCEVQNLLQQMESRPVKITDSMLYQLGSVN
ncbi:hypothetical protein HYC85_024446 [Camellia sinensis]|uniref:Amine oxidase domain-containing protein n=1 Tax=Camellia sinensis TaxID=4442 RepID=A0A7J7G848_CAMSI|nr:hypothetical protein HYC85_024446 [Camellia sinensis]